MQPTTQYLAMLKRLLALRRRYARELNDVGVQLLDRAIDATFRECEDAGLLEEAWAILAEY